MAPILGSVFWTPKWGPLFGPILQIPGKFLLAGIGPLKANRRQRKHTTCCNLMTSSEHAASAMLVGAHAPPDRGGPVCGPGFLCGFRNPFWGPCEGPSFCVLPVFCAGWFWGFVSVKRLYLGCSIVLWVSH